MQDTATGQCKALPPGARVLQSGPCDSSVAAQRWRPATGYESAPAGESWLDSRLESAVNPGMCAMLQAAANGSLEAVVGSCYAPDMVSPALSLPTKVRGGQELCLLRTLWRPVACNPATAPCTFTTPLCPVATVKMHVFDPVMVCCAVISLPWLS